MTPTDSMAPVEAALGALLDRVRRAWRRVAVLNASAQALGAAAVMIALAAAVERFLPIPDGAAMLLATATGAVTAAVVIACAWPLRLRPDDRRVARFVEERYPACGDTIVTAVDIAAQRQEPGTTGREFAPLVMASAVRTLSTLDLGAAVDPRETRRAAARAIAAAVACVLAIAFAVPLFDRALEVGGMRLFPASVTVSVPGDLRVPAGNQEPDLFGLKAAR